MKLHLPVLERIIDVPTKDTQELRHLLDDLGLEVKDVDSSAGYPIFNIETLANRGDHLHAVGVAREIAARQLSAIKLPPAAPELPQKGAGVMVRVETPKCPRYALLEMTLPEGFAAPSEVAQVIAPTPTRHPIVDILNYIQLEIGQPMHAFDRDKVEGEVAVVLSSVEETVQALDGKSYVVPAGSLLIRDRKKTIAVAGVIGCANTMCTPETRRVLIESAAFDPVCVRLTARKMGISTDASYVFERGCDSECVPYALKRLVYLAQGSRGSVSANAAGHPLGLSQHPGKSPDKRQIKLSLKNIRRQMNLPRLAEAEVLARLKNLGYQIEKDDESYLVTVPSWRLWDVQYEEDLIEDFVRSHGFNGVKLSLPEITAEVAPANEFEQLQSQAETVLLGSGFFEVITECFIGNDDLALLQQLDSSVAKSTVRISNALERSCANLKTTNVLHLAQVARHNMRRGVASVKVYEFSRLFGLSGANANPSDDEYTYERDVLTLAQCGRWAQGEFRKAESVEQRLQQMRGVLAGLFEARGAQLRLTPGKCPYLHPGQQATIKAGRAVVGLVGALHPALAQKLELGSDLIYAELDTAALIKLARQKEFQEPSEFPAIRRDVTLQVPLEQFAEDLCGAIEESQPENLSDVIVVDAFRRDQEPFRRISYRLTFQRPDRTLEHAEVDAAMQRVLSALKEKHAVELAG